MNRLKPLSDFDVKCVVDKEVEKEKIRTESAIAQYKERFSVNLYQETLYILSID